MHLIIEDNKKSVGRFLVGGLGQAPPPPPKLEKMMQFGAFCKIFC